jgi:ABC-2 type transport system ATP-binding protein
MKEGLIMPSVIEVRVLTKRFGEVLAVDQLSFTVERGTVTGFLGPNGAGKTTTLRMLLGLVTPSSGTAVINGRPYRELPEPRHVVGAVLEASNPYPGRTAVNHLRIEALAGDAPRARVDEVLDMVGLTAAAGRRVGQYSLGMRQRLGLATALLCDPEILILDEPANGLDPEGVHWLRRLLRRLADEGRTVLVSSHILAEVAQTVDSVVIMNHGQLVTKARLDELTEHATQVIRVRTPRPAQLAALLAENGAGARLAGPDRLEVTGASGETIGTVAAEAAIPIYETTAEAADLEDVFLLLTGNLTDQEAVR